MIRLAQNSSKGSVSLPSIAKVEGISLGYLERLFAKLKKAGLIKAVIGASGGYKLGQPPSRITIFEIVKVLEGEMSLFHCINEKGKIYCDKKCICGVPLVLIKVQAAINKSLKSIKLSELI